MPLDKNFKKHLSKLRQAKIFFDNIETASSFINNNYENIIIWWNDKKVQKIRKKFCNDYCYYTNKDIKIFEKVFKL